MNRRISKLINELAYHIWKESEGKYKGNQVRKALKKRWNETPHNKRNKKWFAAEALGK